MKQLILISRWLCIIISVIIAFILLIITILIVFVRQEMGGHVGSCAIENLPILPLLFYICLFTIISILFGDDDERGGEFLTHLSAGLAHIFGLNLILHWLGYNLLGIIAQHHYKADGLAVPVLDGLAKACPWWLIITMLAMGAGLDSTDSRFSPLGKVAFFIFGPYLVLKIILLF